MSVKGRLEDRWSPWFRAMEALGEDTRIRWGKLSREGEVLATGEVRHEDHDGVGLFVKLLREHEGFTGAAPTLMQKAPPWRGRYDIATRVLRAPDRAPLGWRSMNLRTSRELPDAFAFTLLDEAETARVVSPKKARAILSCRVLYALHTSVIPDLAVPCDRDVWLLPVNMRGPVKTKSEVANTISFLPIGITTKATAIDIQRGLRGMHKANLHWGTWDAMGVRAALGYRFLRVFTRHLYRGLRRQGGTGWLGSFSFGGIVAEQGATPKFAWYGCPPTSLMWPISAASFVWGGRMSLALQVHASLGRDRAWASSAIDAWKTRLLQDANEE
jgi:hypothetical protein